MFEVDLFRTFARELLSSGELPRGPTPSSVLGATGGIAAKINGGEVTGRASAGYLFNTAHVSETISGCRTCVDLGCGTAVQLLQIASVNPEILFTGVDREPAMLQRAAINADKMGIRNVQWLEDDIADPKRLSTLKSDAVIANMTLHDLPDLESRTRFIAAIRKIVSPDGAMYLEDFVRLKHPKSIEFFANFNAPHPRDDFYLLFRTSLAAALTYKDLLGVKEMLPATQLFTTLPLRLIAIIKTSAREVSLDTRARLTSLRAELPKQFRRDLDNLQRSFRVGGMKTKQFES